VVVEKVIVISKPRGSRNYSTLRKDLEKLGTYTRGEGPWWYEVEVQLLENESEYLHTGIAVDDGPSILTATLSQLPSLQRRSSRQMTSKLDLRRISFATRTGCRMQTGHRAHEPVQ
jgi:hypothetical protein